MIKQLNISKKVGGIVIKIDEVSDSISNEFI